VILCKIKHLLNPIQNIYIKLIHIESPFHGVRTRVIGIVEKQDSQGYTTDTCYIVSHNKKGEY